MSVTGSNPVQPADEVEEVLKEMSDLYFSLTKKLVDHGSVYLLTRVADDMKHFGTVIGHAETVLRSMAERVAPAGEEDQCGERAPTDDTTANGSSGIAAG